MNRLGMLVDLSHVSPDTMRARPVSQCRSGPSFPTPPRGPSSITRRNVPGRHPGAGRQKNGGVGHGEFRSRLRLGGTRPMGSRSRRLNNPATNSPPYAGLYIGQPERAKAALEQWDKGASEAAGLHSSRSADHAEQIRKGRRLSIISAWDLIFDGIPDGPPWPSRLSIANPGATGGTHASWAWSDSDIAQDRRRKRVTRDGGKRNVCQ